MFWDAVGQVFSFVWLQQVTLSLHVSAVTFVLSTFTLTPRDWQHHNGDIYMGSLRCNNDWFGQYLIIQDEPQPWAMQMLR